MRSLRSDGRHVTLDRQAPAPAAAPGEALIRPLRLGVSMEDVEHARARTGFVGVLGHEFVGVVEQVTPAPDAPPALRERAAALKGRRVVASPVVPCTRCELCRAGLSLHCRSRQVLGVSGRDGCFADRFTLPTPGLVPVPDDVDDDRAVFAALAGAALHAAQVIRVEGKAFVTVLGDDALALLTAQALARLNASVRLLGRQLVKLALCERWGVKHRPLDEVGRRQDQDAVVDCTGQPGMLATAMQLVRARGKIVLLASPATPGGVAGPGAGAAAPLWNGVDLAPLIAGELELYGARGSAVGEGLAAIQRGGVDVLPLITRRMRLEDGLSALQIAGDPEQVRVLMEP